MSAVQLEFCFTYPDIQYLPRYTVLDDKGRFFSATNDERKAFAIAGAPMHKGKYSVMVRLNGINLMRLMRPIRWSASLQRGGLSA